MVLIQQYSSYGYEPMQYCDCTSMYNGIMCQDCQRSYQRSYQGDDEYLSYLPQVQTCYKTDTFPLNTIVS